MKFDRKNLLLYAVTDRTWLYGKTLSHQVEEALLGGVTMVQLREKDLPFEKFLSSAIEIKAVCNKYSVPFIINDNVEVAFSCDSDGVHIGQSDMDALKTRQILGKNKIIGVSVHSLEQAVYAENCGADYLGVGAVFGTSTKKDANHITFEILKSICCAVSIPVVAIGGINANNIEKLYGSGISGVALVSSIFAQNDVRTAASKMRSLSEKTVGYMR